MWLRELPQEADMVVHFDQWRPIENYAELASFLARNLRSRRNGHLPSLIEVNRRLARVQNLDLLSFVSRGPQSNLRDGDRLARALAEDLAEAPMLWIALDHASTQGGFVRTWIRKNLLQVGIPCGMRLFAVGDELTSTQDVQIDMPRMTLEVKPFTVGEVAQFCAQSTKTCALAKLSWDEASRLTENLPVWLQWLANCPSSWFEKAPDKELLTTGCLKFLQLPDYADSLVRTALSHWLDDGIAEQTEISEESELPKSTWIARTSLLDPWDHEKKTLHECLRREIVREVENGLAPHTEFEYHTQLFHIFFQHLPTDDSGMGNSRYQSPSWQKVIEAVLVHGFSTGLQIPEAEQLLNGIIPEITFSNPHFLGTIARAVTGVEGDMLGRLWTSLQNQTWEDATDILRFLCRQYDAENTGLQSKCYLMLGLFNYLGDHDVEADSAFNDAIRYDPREARAHLGKGLVLVDKRQWDQAIAEFSKAIALDDQLALAYNERGAAYFALNKHELAIQDYSTAARISPGSVHALANMGIVYQQAGEFQIASEWFQRALRIDAEETRRYVALTGRIALRQTITVH